MSCNEFCLKKQTQTNKHARARACLGVGDVIHRAPDRGHEPRRPQAGTAARLQGRGGEGHITVACVMWCAVLRARARPGGPVWRSAPIHPPAQTVGGGFFLRQRDRAAEGSARAAPASRARTLRLPALARWLAPPRCCFRRPAFDPDRLKHERGPTLAPSKRLTVTCSPRAIVTRRELCARGPPPAAGSVFERANAFF